MTNLDLGPVQKTLLLPLIGRAYVSKHYPDFFYDKKAVDLYNQLDFNKARIKRSIGRAGLFSMAIRAIKMDQAILTFLESHPEATILNMGAGLDTAFWRVDNQKLNWIDLDLEDSMAVRQQILPSSARNTHLVQSMFDPSWIQKIPNKEKGVFIQIPGVLPYIEESTVLDFFKTILPQIPNVQVVFDVVSGLGKHLIGIGIKASGMPEADLKWALNNPKKLEEVAASIEVMNYEPYFKEIHKELPITFFETLSMRFSDLMRMAQIVPSKILG